MEHEIISRANDTSQYFDKYRGKIVSLGEEAKNEINTTVWMPNGDPSKKLWKTKEGKLVSVKLMSTSHIKNCLKFCNPYANDCWDVIFKEELRERGIRYDQND